MDLAFVCKDSNRQQRNGDGQRAEWRDGGGNGGCDDGVCSGGDGDVRIWMCRYGPVELKSEMGLSPSIL